MGNSWVRGAGRGTSSIGRKQVDTVWAGRAGRLLGSSALALTIALTGTAAALGDDAPPTPAVEAQVVLSIGPTSCNLDAPPPGDGLPAACRVTIADTEIPVSELPTRVAQLLGNRPANGRVLFLAADDTLNYEGVLRIVDLAKSKLDDVAIEVITTH